MVRPRLCHAYLSMNLVAETMLCKMEAVLSDPHHQDIIRRGPALGYRMPDTNGITNRTAALKAVITHYRDYDFHYKPGSQIALPARTVHGLFFTAIHSALLVDDVFKNIRHSEYMLWLRALKVTGEPYQGPTSLQEVCNTWQSLPQNWLERLSL